MSDKKYTQTIGINPITIVIDALFWTCIAATIVLDTKISLVTYALFSFVVSFRFLLLFFLYFFLRSDRGSDIKIPKGSPAHNVYTIVTSIAEVLVMGYFGFIFLAIVHGITCVLNNEIANMANGGVDASGKH